jgi:hypothetical protein
MGQLKYFIRANNSIPEIPLRQVQTSLVEYFEQILYVRQLLTQV